MEKTQKTLELTEVLAALRNDLVAAQKEKKDNVQLSIDEIEVELQTVVTQEKGGKVKIGILNIGQLLGLGGVDAEMQGKLVQVATQKIKLKISAKSLNPKTGEMETTNVSDKDKF